MEHELDFRIPRTAANSSDYEQLFSDITETIWPGNNVADPVAHIAQGTPGQRALFVTTLFARLVDNGGLDSFFEAAGHYSRNVAEGLAILGCSDMRQAFLEGLEIQSGRKPGLLDAIDDRLYQGSSVEARLFPYFKE